jgi:hypothetical protein
MVERGRGAGQPSWPLNPYNIQVAYGGQQMARAGGQGSGWFSPLMPMPPVAPPEVAGRTWDFIPGFNLPTAPRQYEIVGFPTLRALADSYDLLRLAIETRKDQMTRLHWSIRMRDDGSGAQAKSDAANVPKAVQSRIDAAEAFFRRPDGVTKFRPWFRSLLEDVFVIDAPALYCERNRGGQLIGLQQIDGSTIKRVIDDWGRTPRPFEWDGTTPFTWNAYVVDGKNWAGLGFKRVGDLMYPPAYQEVLKGLPAVDYTTWDLLYRPYNMRPGKAYGYSPVEQIIATVNIALRRQMFTLEYFREGSVPDALIGTPETWTPEQISAFQTYWDALYSGNLAYRRRAKFMPGSKASVVQTKQPELQGKFDEWLARIVSYAFSLSPQWAVQQMNRATAGTAKETAEEEGLEPIKAWWKETADDVLETEFDSGDLEWGWVEEIEVDQEKQQKILTGYVGSGLLTINQALADLGRDPSDNPAADMLMVKTGNGYVPIEALTIDGKQASIDAFGMPPAPGPGGANGDRPPGGDGGGANADAAPKGDDSKGVGKVADAPFVKRLRRLPPIDFERPLASRAQARLRTGVAAGLRKLGKSVAAQVRRELRKVAKDEKANNRRRAGDIAESIDLGDIDDLRDIIDDEGGIVAGDATKETLAQFGVDDRSELVDQVNEAAADWARDNAAELVGTDDEDGLLAETTREVIRNTIADGLDENVGLDEIIDNIVESTAFSEDRAELIARTEIRRANSQGALLGAKGARDELGVAVKKIWLTAGDDLVDEDVCEPNEDQGPIDLDDDFQSGDDAPPGHPRCRCAISWEVDEPSDESDDEE